MTKDQSVRQMTRRELLSNGATVGAAFVVGGGFIAHTKEAWAMEPEALSPHVMATLVQMARDIYPHDRLSDERYAVAVKGHDETAASDRNHALMLERGVKLLDALAVRRGSPSYLGTGWEIERVKMLRAVEDRDFFQAVRGGLVVSLYNQKEVWGHFGYEGASFEEGGYIDRGFDDIAWL